MTRYSVQPGNKIFVKCYGVFSFPKHMGRNIVKNISINLISKYSHRLVDDVKQSATDSIKTASKRAIQKTAEATGDLIGNKITDKITRASKIHHISIQKQMKKKHLEKYLYLQN